MALLCIAVCIALTWVLKVYFDRPEFLSYTSPTIVAVAISYIIVFSKLELSSKAKRIVEFFAPAAFGVYLLHDNSLIRKRLISKSFTWIAASSPWLIPIEVIGCALGIFAVCLLIDKVRIWFFKQIHIPELSEKIVNKISGIVNGA